MADAIDRAAVISETALNICLAQVRNSIPAGESLMECEDCGREIPEGRRKAVLASRRVSNARKKGKGNAKNN